MDIQITDISLPERSASNILSFPESNAMPARVPCEETQRFNCWGFTAYYYQWEERAFWMTAEQMKTYLKVRTNPISKEEVRAGDIAVFSYPDWMKDGLAHTAVILPSGKMVYHKPGGCELCIDTLESAMVSYGRNVTYVRAIGSETKISEKTI